MVSDIDPFFSGKLLQPSDKSNLLVTTVYNRASSVAANIGDDFVTESETEFMDSLQLDENGNLGCTVNIGGKMQRLHLNRHSKPSRSRTSEQIVQSIKDDLTDIKHRILKNIKDNIEDQCDENTFYYCWSGLDLELKLPLQLRIDRLRDIVSRFCSERVHVVQKFASPNHDREEDPTVPDKWEGYEMHLHYPSKINCTEEKMLVEIKADWPSIGKLCMVEVNKAKGKRPLDQLSVWQQFVKEHSTEFPNMCQLIQIMVATAANTSPLERSYTKLQMVAAKRRHHFEPKNLEILCLLAALNKELKPRKPTSYAKELKLLE